MSSTETLVNNDTADGPTLRSKDYVRPLGAGEELMWLLDLSSRIHFALVAEVGGRTTVEEWRAALDTLQRRHPLLSVCIDSNHSRIPHFRHVEGEPIPLRVVETVEMRWERELERELHTQFDPRQAPLMRAVLALSRIQNGIHSCRTSFDCGWLLPSLCNSRCVGGTLRSTTRSTASHALARGDLWLAER
jgi:hypothetical protein